MKASNKTVWIVAAIVGLFFLSFQGTSSWRASHGLTFSALRSPEANVERELRQFDAKLKPVAERRAKLREQLQRSQEKERELGQGVLEALRRLDEAKRTELRVQFESGSLSAANQADPEIAVLYARYREVAALRRHTSALRETLAKYEYELTRALAERDRLVERRDTIEALGFDPENELTLDAEERYGALDELIAQTDSARPEDRPEPLEVEDVVSGDAEAAAFASEIFDGTSFADDAIGEDDAFEYDAQLSERLDNFNAEIQKPDGSKIKIGSWKELKSHHKIALCLFALAGFSVMFLLILVLGIIGIFSATKNQSQVTMVQGQLPTQVVVQQGMSPGRIVFIVISTLFWTCVGGPIGGVFGLLLGLILSSWRAFIRFLGAIGFIVVASIVALLFFAGVCALVVA